MFAMAHLTANSRLSDHRRHRAMPTSSILPLNLRRGRSPLMLPATRPGGVDRAKGAVASDSRRAGLLHGARQSHTPAEGPAGRSRNAAPGRLPRERRSVPRVREGDVVKGPAHRAASRAGYGRSHPPHPFARARPGQYPSGPGGTGPLGANAPSASCRSWPSSGGQKTLMRCMSVSARSRCRSLGPTL
jgi:hypothetical protein